MGELNASLVRAPGVEHELEHRPFTSARKHADVGHRILGAADAAIDDPHRSVAIRGERVAEGDALLGARPTSDTGEVCLRNVAALELARKAGVGLPTLREREKSTRIAVEPLVDAEIAVAPALHEKPLQARDDVVRPIWICSLGRNPGGLVDDDEILVLMNHPRVAKVGPNLRSVHRAWASITCGEANRRAVS